MAVLLWCLGRNAQPFSAASGEEKTRKNLTVHVFHNSVHRYFVFTLKIALTSMKRLFNLAGVDG